MSTFTDIFGGLFDETDLGRRATFSTLLSGLAGQQGSPINRFNRDLFERQFDSQFQRFLGETGQRIIRGETPQTFAQFSESGFTGRDVRRLPGSQARGGRAPLTSQARFFFQP